MTRAFFADLFLMLARTDNVQPITAAEVAARQEEKLIALGPVLERTNDELLDPMVDRMFARCCASARSRSRRASSGASTSRSSTEHPGASAALVGVVGQDRFLRR